MVSQVLVTVRNSMPSIQVMVAKYLCLGLELWTSTVSMVACGK